MSGRHSNQKYKRGGRGTNANGVRGRGGQGRGQGRRAGRGGGRGRGKGRDQNNQYSSHENTRSSPRCYTNFKRNGEKGADAHTVPESTRIKFTKILVDMRENPNMDSLEMSSDLTNTERKFLHTLAMQLGLKSKSTGRGENRRITVTKASNKKTIAGVDPNASNNGKGVDENLPYLKVGAKGIAALEKYAQMFPPNEIEAAEATETGSSLSMQKNSESDAKLLDTLRQLNIESSTKVPSTRPRKKVNLEKRARLHHVAQQAKIENPNYGNMQKMRAKLPAYSYQKGIVDTIATSRITILSGDTGCGKSTQVPQFLLDSNPCCNIVVTQPRRISAISIAERVAQERCENVGGTVGYNVRLEGASSDSTQLVFVTPGVLLRKFQSSPDLEEFTHIVIDEIHERDKYTEFLMIALRELMNRRTDLHVVLMSATIQTNELRQYWNGVGAGDNEHLDDFAPSEINIPGRTFPVQSFYLEDVLAMTGIVSDAKIGSSMGDLEKDLSALLSSRTAASANSKQKGKRTKNGGTNNPATLTVSESSLVCVMCNQGGFKCAEELGSHMGLCTGLNNINMIDLENKVRCTEVRTAFSSSKPDEADLIEDASGDEIVDEDDYQVHQDEYDDGDNDDEHYGMHEGKWDGESPFAVADVIEPSANATFIEEEMLQRYQMMHDDEQVDDMLILETLRYIIKSSYLDGAVLCFLPGWQEISEVTLLLESTYPFNDNNKFSILPLHSGIPSKEQRLVFQRPKAGIRKIILSTNIAETSVTIDDVAFVIDSGRAKEKNYDPHLKSSTLQPMWISKASAKQRRGRAGRTKAGVCFHLFSRRRHDSFRDFLESELLRTSLEEICLQCKKLNLAPGGPDDDDGIPAFLAAALTPPHPKSVSNALEKLVELGAMDAETNDLTRLGHCLSCLSVSPEVGKMIIWSYILGCSRDASSMAVAMSYKSPFIIPPNHMKRAADEAKVELSQGTESDQVTVLKVLEARDDFYKQGRKNQFYSYCRNNFINFATIQIISDLRRNIARELSTLGFPDPTKNKCWHNRNASSNVNLPFLQSTIVAGVYPNVAARQDGATNFSTSTNRKSKIHVGSINACRGQPLSQKSQMLEFIAYGEMVKGVTSYTMNQTTHLASVIPIMLLCGSFRIRPADMGEEEKSNYAVMSVDDWISFKCDKEVAASVAVLRKRLDAVFHHFVSDPDAGHGGLCEKERETLIVFDAVVKSSFINSPARL